MPAIAKKNIEDDVRLSHIIVTPDMAMEMLEHNTLNRPLSQAHVARIASLIKAGKWKFNGDTIKMSDDGQVLDGQHRLWACIEAKLPIETVVVYGVSRDAFQTVDTIHRHRSHSDALALVGMTDYRRDVASALAWLVRWQRGSFRGPFSRVENAEIEELHAKHPSMIEAVARARKAVRGYAAPGLIGFLFYVIASRDPMLAERYISTLENPGHMSVDDPFFRLRTYLVNAKLKNGTDAVMTIALTIRAANAAKQGRKIGGLSWRNQGERPEPFPTFAF